MSQYPKYGNNHPYRKKNIGNIVQDAIKGVSYSRNLEELRNNIDITIREVSDLAKSGNPADVQPQEPPKAYTSPRANSSKAPVYERPESPRFNPPSKGLYTFLLILGCFFSCIFAIVCILSLLASFFYTSLLAPLAGVCGVLMLFSLALAIFAGNRNGKILRFRRYRKFIGDAEFCSLEQMAASCMEKTSKTKNAVQKMITAGWFPNGHIDNEGTTLMLTEETYRMYLLAEDAKLQRQAEEEAKRKEEEINEPIIVTEKIMSDAELNEIEGVVMTIKEGTLTPTGATVVITDYSEKSHIYGEEYRIDKLEDGTWKPVDVVLEGNYGWNSIGYKVDRNKKLVLEIDWKWLYKSLSNGTYRIVKYALEDSSLEKKYFSVEFEITE